MEYFFTSFNFLLLLCVSPVVCCNPPPVSLHHRTKQRRWRSFMSSTEICKYLIIGIKSFSVSLRNVQRAASSVLKDVFMTLKLTLHTLIVGVGASQQCRRCRGTREGGRFLSTSLLLCFSSRPVGLWRPSHLFQHFVPLK